MKPIFENEKYTIKEIPLNYMIDFKLETDGIGRLKGKRVKLLPEPHYASLDKGLNYAIDLAEATIEHYHEDKEK